MSAVYLPGEPLTYRDVEALVRDLLGDRLDGLESRLADLTWALDEIRGSAVIDRAEIRQEISDLRDKIATLR